ncbi:MAG: glycosyltransferase family 2 protein [Kiritimatiellae bacterium]|jgi:glycosyltransferase involved in cell wall biosynthesis|nr:glycosyltransferase family 2 protein [Kiritimatiellia bacterium]
MNNLPFVSIIIPTLNSGSTLDECLTAIRSQEYPKDQYEIIIADAGSTDDTKKIAKSFNVDQIVFNELTTGEAGKTAGIKAAKGEIIALIDSDNIMPFPTWLNMMVEPFEDEDIMGSEPISFTWRKEDHPLIRYFTLLGMNDPVCLFLGNYDRRSAITNRWTNLPVRQEDKGDYLKLDLSNHRYPTIGANGFVFRKKLLDYVDWSPYFFDIDIIPQAGLKDINFFAKVKCGIVHLYCTKLSNFKNKQERRIKDFLFFSTTKERKYPWKANNQAFGIILFSLATVTVIPLVIQAIIGFVRKPDICWIYHVPVCWITLYVYAKETIKKAVGIKPQIKNRKTWQTK